MRGYANSPHAFSQVRNFNIKFSECNSSHIGDFCPRRVDFEIREERDDRVPICGVSRAIAGTAGHPSFRKTRCGGQIMPICESSKSVAIARSCFCRRFPRSELSKGSLPYTTPHVSAFFVHDESISRKKGLGAQEQNPASPRRPSRPSTRTPG